MAGTEGAVNNKLTCLKDADSWYTELVTSGKKKHDSDELSARCGQLFKIPKKATRMFYTFTTLYPKVVIIRKSLCDLLEQLLQPSPLMLKRRRYKKGRNTRRRILFDNNFEKQMKTLFAKEREEEKIGNARRTTSRVQTSNSKQYEMNMSVAQVWRHKELLAVVYQWTMCMDNRRAAADNEKQPKQLKESGTNPPCMHTYL
ncbi:hypothetical protein EOD39_2957 [Acipenser ruthenus]|uniref:Uncharacterized protein n=1 Tax=Acipenser ruthenus TaxID=7906 RepID=A0A444TXC7_ACIRT|nr:hypothetical protein EOD39_2957 [Acipenser ruthenus]